MANPYSHDQRQGTGLATVLQGGDKAAGLFIQGAQQDAAQRRQQKLDAEKAASEAIKSMKDFNPEFFYVHEAEKKQALDAWAQSGADLFAQGKNPFQDASEEARAFRKEMARINQLSEVSTQMKQGWESGAKAITTNPNKYTPESIKAFNDYYNTSASKTMAEGKLPPNLVEKTPVLNRIDTFTKAAKNWSEQFPGQDIDDKTIEQLSNQMLEDAALGPQLAESYRSTLSLLSPDKRRAIQERADGNGRTVAQQMAFEDAKFAQRNRTPFSGTTFINNGLKLINPTTVGSSGPSGGSKRVDEKDLKQQAFNAAANMVAEDPRALSFYDKPTLLPREGDDDIEYSQRLTQYIADKLFEQTSKNRESFLTEKGKNDRLLKDSGDLWLKHIMSPKAEYNREAAAHLYMLKGQIGNLTVTEVDIKERMENGKPVRYISMELEGAPKMIKAANNPAGYYEQLDDKTEPQNEDAAIKAELSDAGLNPDQFGYRQVGTKRYIDIDIDMNRESALLSLYRMKFNQDKQPYSGAYSKPDPKLSTMTTKAAPGPKWQ